LRSVNILASTGNAVHRHRDGPGTAKEARVERDVASRKARIEEQRDQCAEARNGRDYTRVRYRNRRVSALTEQRRDRAPARPGTYKGSRRPGRDECSENGPTAGGKQGTPMAPGASRPSSDGPSKIPAIISARPPAADAPPRNIDSQPAAARVRYHYHQARANTCQQIAGVGARSRRSEKQRSVNGQRWLPAVLRRKRMAQG